MPSSLHSFIVIGLFIGLGVHCKMQSDRFDYSAKVPIYSKRDKVPFLCAPTGGPWIFMYFQHSIQHMVFLSIFCQPVDYRLLRGEFYLPLCSPAQTDTCHILWAQIYAELRGLKEFILTSWSAFEGILVSINSAQCNFKG